MYFEWSEEKIGFYKTGQTNRGAADEWAISIKSSAQSIPVHLSRHFQLADPVPIVNLNNVHYALNDKITRTNSEAKLQRRILPIRTSFETFTRTLRGD